MEPNEIEKLQRGLEEANRQIERLQAINAIQCCMAHYETIHISPEENWRTPDCFALWRKDVAVEVSDWGCFFGPEAVKGFWSCQTAENNNGAIFFHTLATPAIQVAGDCKTAKVTWASPGFETMPPLPGLSDEFKCFWCWGKYGIDFIKNPQTGEWKIWHMKWFRTIRSDFYTDWYNDSAKTLKGMPGPGFQTPDLKPSVFHEPYSIEKIPHPFPIDPQPYETYDGSFRWLYGDDEYEQKYGVHYPEEYQPLYNMNYPNVV
jgi:hypothetical protein